LPSELFLKKGVKINQKKGEEITLCR